MSIYARIYLSTATWLASLRTVWSGKDYFVSHRADEPLLRIHHGDHRRSLRTAWRLRPADLLLPCRPFHSVAGPGGRLRWIFAECCPSAGARKRRTRHKLPRTNTISRRTYEVRNSRPNTSSGDWKCLIILAGSTMGKRAIVPPGMASIFQAYSPGLGCAWVGRLG